MKANRRSIVVATALGLLAALLLYRVGSPAEPATDPARDEPLSADAPDTDPALPLARKSSSAPQAGLRVQEQGAAGGKAEVTQECQACRESECTDFRGIGLDMLSGCTSRVNSAYGADPNDSQFIADCTAVLDCAARTHCADSEVGLSGCYCGSRSIDECIERGPASDAPCVAQWQRATRTHDNHELAARFSDPMYPAGWAHYVLRCDHTRCNSECVRTGTEHASPSTI